MTSYDPNVLQQYADELYSRAEWIAIGGMLKGFLIGVGLLVVALAVADVMHIQDPPPTGVVAIIFCCMGSFVGYHLGKSKSFLLRLQAQTVLCQMQTEYNTRAGK